MKAKTILTAILVISNLCGLSLAEWSEPVPVTEVNSEYAEWTPFLSFDGLSLYFARGHGPAFYDFRIYEATRPVPYGPFTSVGEISGTLNSSPGNVMSPWVSPDNLRMYYFTESNLVYKLKVTERMSDNDPWPVGKNIPGLDALGGRPQAPSLTADELIIVFSSYNAPGGFGGFDLWMATRPDKYSSFGNVRNLTEINTAYKESKPYISPDGLTLYFPTDRNGSGQLFRATRASLTLPFGNLEHLSFFDVPRGGGHPSLSSDGSALYMAKTISGIEDIYVSYLDTGPGPGPIAHWKFDEGSGSVAYDSAGNNDGTIYGAQWTTGQVNGALSFDGVDDYVDIPYDSSLDINTQTGISLSVWINFNSYPDSLHQGPVFGLFNSAGQGVKNYLFIGKSIYGNPIKWIQWPSPSGAIISIKPDLDTWYHVVAVEDSPYRAIYINGSLDSSDHLSQSYTGNPPDTIRIGSRADAWAPYYFDGSIDDVRIYDRALSSEQIWELYSPSVIGPIAHWKFDEGSGSVAYDSAGDNDGTIYGATWTTGQLNNALNFDGVDDYVEVNSADELKLNITGSISVWVLPNDLYRHSIVNKHGAPWWGNKTVNYWLVFGSYNQISFVIGDGANYVQAMMPLEGFAVGKWNNIVGTWNSSNIKIYGNGELKDNQANNLFDLVTSDDYPVRIGYDNGAGWFFDGIIDDVRIYNRALSDEEIWDIYVPHPTEPLDIDIKPGSCPNPLNVKSRGVLPVAISGSEDFDVYSIDIASIRLAGVAPNRSSYEDVTTPVSEANECECSTEGPDGFLDLTLKFEMQGIVETIGEVDHGDELVLELTGVLLDETPIEGSDCVIIRGRHKPLNRADFNGDGIVGMADFAAFAENWLQLR